MREILRSRLFWAGLFLRLILMPFFGSHYLRELFIPFLDSAVLNPGVNPWTLHPPNFFPYGTALFALLFIPRFIAHWLFGASALGVTTFGISLVKLPLLGLDMLLLHTLMKFAGNPRRRKLFIYYWLNPIVIYITYVHGQLDVAAICLLILAVQLISTRRLFASAIVLGLATLCKFHVVATIPIFLAYIWNRNFAREAIRSLTIWLATLTTLSVIGFLPLLMASRFLYASMSSPEALRIFAAQLDFGSGQVLYYGMLCVLLVLGRVCLATRMTDFGLFFGTGTVFGVLLLITNTMPGWYFWIVPVTAMLFSLYVNVPRSLYWAFCGAYLLYFLGKQIQPPFSGILFTLMQTFLAGILIAIWKLVLPHEVVLTGRTRPATFGIAGDSGSGKNHLSSVLMDVFSPRNSMVLEGDDYHKWERGHTAWSDYTHLNPKANHLELLASHALQLQKGLTVSHSQYDHSEGMFSSPRELEPAKAVIVQGLHTLYLRSMRRSLDLKIFLAPDELVRLSWKLQRDSTLRGHSFERILETLVQREPDSRMHIAPQRNFADWIIEFFPTEAITRDEVISGKEPVIGVRFVVWNDTRIESLVLTLNRLENCEVRYHAIDADFDRVMLEFRGNPTCEQIADIAREIYPNLRHLTRGWQAPKWRPGIDGVMQLMTVSLLSNLQKEAHA